VHRGIGLGIAYMALTRLEPFLYFVLLYEDSSVDTGLKST
jgi:hypothetical protein